MLNDEYGATPSSARNIKPYSVSSVLGIELRGGFGIERCLVPSCARYRAATLDTEPRAQIDNKAASFKMPSSEVAPCMVISCEFILFNLIL